VIEKGYTIVAGRWNPFMGILYMHSTARNAYPILCVPLDMTVQAGDGRRKKFLFVAGFQSISNYFGCLPFLSALD
jgi:hypothetical protein